MAVRVPFDFDTSETPTLIMRGLAGVFVVEVAGAAFTLFVTHNRAGAGALLVSAAMTIFFGRLFLTKLEGSAGRI